MPRVPTYDSPQVAPTGLSGARFEPQRMPDVAGPQTQQLSANLMRGGQALERVAMDTLRLAQETRMSDGLNQAKEEALRLTHDKDAGFLAARGNDALERSGGKPLADEYRERLQERISGIAAKFNDPQQRDAFMRRAGDIVTPFYGQAMQHEASEFKAYSLSVSEGRTATSRRSIAVNFRNPEMVATEIQAIRGETYRAAQLLSKSAEWQEAKVRQAVSSAHRLALGSALDDKDPVFAETYLNKHADEMEADDLLAVRGHITKEMTIKLAMEDVDKVSVVNAFQISEPDAKAHYDASIVTESNHRQFDDRGNPLTSPAGAVGIAQVMRETGPEAARLAGLPWSEHRWKYDKGYNYAIGFAYFREQLRVNKGDVRKAWAAYNAGPGRLRQAIRKAGDEPDGWLQHMPKETREYVAKNLRNVQAKAGKPARQRTLQEMDEQLRADPNVANDPERLRIARAELGYRHRMQAEARREADAEATKNAMQGMQENGGRFSELPASVRAAVPPEVVPQLQNYGQAIHRGDDVSDDGLYNLLSSNLPAFAQMSDADFFKYRMHLSEKDFAHFSNERAKLRGEALKVAAGAADLDSATVARALDQSLQMMGKNTKPKEGSSDAARLGALRRFVDQSVYAAQANAGRKFSEAEITDHINRLFAQSTEVRGWFSTKSTPTVLVKASDISSAERKKLKAALARAGITDPTDAQIEDAYRHMKVSQ